MNPWESATAGLPSPLVAVDLDDPGIATEARQRGATAVAGLGPALLRLGAAALAAGRAQDELAAYPAVRHFARRDAERHVVDDGDVRALESVRNTTVPPHRICIVCEETSAEQWIAALTAEGGAVSR